MYPIYKIWIGAGEKIGAKFSEDFIGQRFWPSGKTDTPGPLVPYTSDEWRDPESLEEWFLFIPHPYGQLAVKRRGEDDTHYSSRKIDIKTIKSPAAALMEGFSWGQTKEGWTFWNQFHEFVRTGKGNIPTLASSEPEESVEEKKELIYIYTLNRPGLIDLTRTLVAEAGWSCLDSVEGENVYIAFSTLPSGLKQSQLWGKPSPVVLEEYLEVSNADFITALANLPKKEKEPEKPKEKEPHGLDDFPVEGMDTVIFKDNINIGCQEISMDNWRDLEKRIEAWKETEISATRDYFIVLTPEGIVMRSKSSRDDYEPISWETYDTLQKEVNHFLKE